MYYINIFGIKYYSSTFCFYLSTFIMLTIFSELLFPSDKQCVDQNFVEQHYSDNIYFGIHFFFFKLLVLELLELLVLEYIYFGEN